MMDKVAGKSTADEETSIAAVDLLDKWLRANIVRSFSVNFPSWACFLAAFLLSMAT
jgi:hypothetical protein